MKRHIIQTRLGILSLAVLVPALAAHASTTTPVQIDASPAVCPNVLPIQSPGNLAVALLGSSMFDVTQVDVNSIQLHVVDGFGTLGAALAGAASIGSVQPIPSHHQFTVLSSVGGENVLGNCTIAANGNTDLVVQFSIPAVVRALGLGSQPNGATVPLGVTGKLLGGGTFSSLNSPDYVTLQVPGAPSVTAVLPGAGAVRVAPNDFVITAPNSINLTAGFSGALTPSFQWFQEGGLLSGVGEVFFTPATGQSTRASFNTAGQYLIKVDASLPSGRAERVVRVTVNLNPNGVFDPNAIKTLLANSNPFTHPTPPSPNNWHSFFLFYSAIPNCPDSNPLCNGGPNLPNYNLTDSPTAHAYYQAIDPAETKQFFGDWLEQNGINLADTTTYTLAACFNAIDLGFGRRMIVSKDGSAWVVTNHRTVDDAVNDVNPIAAVAMEYQRDSTTGNTFTKFYIFDRQNLKVNPRTGKLDGPRVTGANLDGAGVKFVPGLCITCHGGQNPSNVSTGQPYPNPGGHVFAHFLPFDLNGFEYSANPRFTRSAQEDVFRELNQNVLNIETGTQQFAGHPNAPWDCGAYSASGYCSLFPGRYMYALIDLIETWYGQAFNFGNPLAGATLTGKQNSDAVPASWAGTPFYPRVFARSCRNCHSTRSDGMEFDSSQYPGYGLDTILAGGSLSYGSMVVGSLNALTPAHITTPPSPGMIPGPPSFGIMPHTSRTFERFWLSTDSDVSPSNRLPNPPGPPQPEVFRKAFCEVNGVICR